MDFFVNLMRNIDRSQLLTVVNSKEFDWSYLENIVR